MSETTQAWVLYAGNQKNGNGHGKTNGNGNGNGASKGHKPTG